MRFAFGLFAATYSERQQNWLYLIEGKAVVLNGQKVATISPWRLPGVVPDHVRAARGADREFGRKTGEGIRLASTAIVPVSGV
jgi:hypothetical protein